MKRILFMVFRNLWRVPYMWIMLCWRAAHTERYEETDQFRFLTWIVRRANIGGNVRVHVSGTENIPKESGYVYYPNHQGLYDVLALVEAVPAPFSVVAKKEVENVQFLKQVFACMRAFLIDRDDIRQSMRIIAQVTQEVKNGRNYLIFAEGTRSKQGNTVGDFKGGSFKAAMKAQCPIVPVALIDCFKPFDVNSIRPVDVQVHFLPPLYYEDYKEMKSTEIAALVRERIQTVISDQLLRDETSDDGEAVSQSGAE